MAPAAHENGHGAAAVQNGEKAGGWRFARGSKEQGGAMAAATGDTLSIRAVRFKIMASVEERGPRPVLPLAHGDPSAFPAFRTAAEAEDAVAAALRTGDFNCYPPGVGLPAARRYVRRSSFFIIV
jgi:nicotianamine aminotransferase